VKDHRISTFDLSEFEYEGFFFKALCPFWVCILNYIRVNVFSIKVGCMNLFYLQICWIIHQFIYTICITPKTMKLDTLYLGFWVHPFHEIAKNNYETCSLMPQNLILMYIVGEWYKILIQYIHDATFLLKNQ